MATPTLTFIGCGNMTRSIINGLVANGFDANNIWVTNPSREKLDALQAQFNVHVTQDNIEGSKQAAVIIIAVKPMHVSMVCEELKEVIAEKNPLIISIVTGVTVELIQKFLQNDFAIVRAMPNIAAAVQAGSTALFASANVSEDQKSLAESIFRAVGIVVWLDDESLMKVVLAVAGSGPAYYFLVMEAMQEAGENMGLPKETVQLLVAQTALGAARMAMESEQEVEQLRQAVTSAKGTTERAINVFEKANLNQIFANAMQAASDRAQELGDQLK